MMILLESMMNKGFPGLTKNTVKFATQKNGFEYVWNSPNHGSNTFFRQIRLIVNPNENLIFMKRLDYNRDPRNPQSTENTWSGNGSQYFEVQMMFLTLMQTYYLSALTFNKAKVEREFLHRWATFAIKTSEHVRMNCR